MPSSDGAADSDPTEGQPSMFEILCENVQTSMLTHNATLQEFFEFKNELLKHALPPKLLAKLTLLSSRLFRSYSEFCSPVSELSRMVRQHSSPWQERADSLRSVRSDYDSMRRKLSIALKRIEIMAAEEERIKKERRLASWERLFIKTMESKSHGRRWKFRIEPLKKRMHQEGFNPYLSDSSGEESDEEGRERELLSPAVRSKCEVNEPEPQSEKSSVLLDKVEEEVTETTPTPPPPPIETVESAACTEDPDYDQYLVVQLYRPSGILKGRDVCCTLAYGQEYYTSKIYPGKAAPGSLLTPQGFHFKLSDDAARTLPPDSQDPLNPIEIPKLTLTLYHESVAHDMAGYLSIALKDLYITDEPTVIVPADTTEDVTELNWAEIISQVRGSIPKEYELKVPAKQQITNDDNEDELPLVPMICHRVKVERHKRMHSGTETVPWNELIEGMGYRLAPDTQSRAVSMICFEDPLKEPPTELKPTEEPPTEPEEEKVSQEELAILSLQHAEEIHKLQGEFEQKLNSLTRTLNRVKADKAREIEQLEQALVEAEQRKGGKGRSLAEIRSLVASRKKKLRITHGLPKWGEDLPEDFFERMELFADESVRKQEELTQRIKREVSVACEKQLATQHKLAPGLRTDTDTITEDVSLPALFMPTPCTKQLVYTPRAYRYFHPTGSTDIRVTQPPSVFKLPALSSNQLTTLNLFELSQQYGQSPQWLHEHAHQSPRYTPTPPPSTCGY